MQDALQSVFLESPGSRVPASSLPFSLLLHPRSIFKTRTLAQEREVDYPGRPVPVFGDAQLVTTVALVVWQTTTVVQQTDEIRVLLDTAGVPQV